MGNCCEREHETALNSSHEQLPKPEKQEEARLPHSSSAPCQFIATNTKQPLTKSPKACSNKQFRLRTHLLKKEVEEKTGLAIKKLNGSIEALYELIGILGSDFILLAENRRTQQKRIIKKFPKLAKTKCTRGMIDPSESFKEEVQILCQLDHPNIIRVHELLQDREFIYIVSEEVVGGELLDFISRSLSEAVVAKIGYQVLYALSYCHAKGIVHKCLDSNSIILQGKPDNSDIHLKIGGLGTTGFLIKREDLLNKIGAVLFMSPEVLDGNYSEKSDVWSCGIILYLLLSGNPPFKGSTTDQVIEKIRTQEVRFPTSTCANISPGAVSLLRTMLSKDPNTRPSAAECLAHPWIQSSRKEVSVNDGVFLDTLQNLKKFRSTQLLKQTVLSFVKEQRKMSQEALAIDDVFRSMDTDNDGQLSQAEILEAYAMIMPRDQAQVIVKRVMKTIDLDRNGLVEYSEFLLASKNHSSSLSQKHLKFVFEVLDKDGNGTITQDEFKEALRTKDRHMSDELWGELLKQVDSNRDGILDFQEFSQLMLRAVED